MLGYISDQRTKAPVFLCNILFLPTDTEQLSLPLFLQLVCFCCQKSKYSHLALTPHTNHTHADMKAVRLSPAGSRCSQLCDPTSELFILNKSLYCPGTQHHQGGAFSAATKGKVSAQQAAGQHSSCEVAFAVTPSQAPLCCFAPGLAPRRAAASPTRAGLISEGLR